MMGNYRVASQLVASQVVLSSIELLSSYTYSKHCENMQADHYSQHSLSYFYAGNTN
jgi:hypothetical protein